MDAPQQSSRRNLILVSSLLVVAIVILTVVFVLQNQPTSSVNTTTTNTSANANVATNGNTNTASTATLTLTPVAQPESETVTYQLGDVGLQFDAPGSWNVATSSSPIGNALSLWGGPLDLLSGSVGGFTSYSFSVDVTNQQGEETLAQSLARRWQYVDAPVTTEYLSVGGLPAIRGTYNQSLGDDVSTLDVVLVQHQQMVFGIATSGTTSAWGSREQELNAVLASFRFIDPAPKLPVLTPSVRGKTSPQGGALSITWDDAPALLNLDDPIFANDPDHSIVSRLYYKVGTVSGGVYDGQDLLTVFERIEGPAFQPNLYRVLYNPTTGAFVYLEKESDTLQYLPGAFTYDTAATITGLDLPASIAVPGTDLSLTLDPFQLRKHLSNLTDLSVAFTDATAGTVYYSDSSECFIVVTPDFLLARYGYDLPFVTSFRQRTYASDIAYYVPNVTWTDGTHPTAEYTYSETGACGFTGCHSIITDADLGSDQLAQAGTTSTGDAVYAYASNNAQALRDAFTNYDQTVYDESLRITYDVFLARTPMFFWRDPFGRLLRFRRADILPMAECGKPVIYLYPTSTQAVNVQVAPNGGFTTTVPQYPSGGWSVVATPDGTLTDSSGAVYDSLFWEGRGINYERPSRGFVWSRQELPSQLDATLATLGLHERERADFLAYWLPRMQGKPYVFVTFLDQQRFDQLAPLTVTPRPTSVIRVFMDYEGLDAPRSVAPLTLTTPERRGFTVVEWGGALHNE